MTTSVWLKAALLWLSILMLAILNGVLREEILIPAIGNFAGLIASGVTLSRKTVKPVTRRTFLT